MKKTILLCALAVLSIEYLRESQVAKVRGELTAVREEIKTVERQRVPRGEFLKARNAAAEAEETVAALQQEIARTNEQLAVAQEKVKAAEKQLSLLPDRDSAASAPGLVKGTYTLLDDTLVYSPDAQLKLGKGLLVSSPSGMMLSDKDLATVAGDLALETPGGTMQATHAFIDVNDGKVELTADSVSFTSK